MAFCKVMHKNNLKYAGELASLSIPQIILVYDAQRHIELFSCVSSGKHRQVRKSEMHGFTVKSCIKKNRIECRGVYSPGSRLGSFGIWVYDAPLDNSSAAKPPAIQYFPRVKLF